MMETNRNMNQQNEIVDSSPRSVTDNIPLQPAKPNIPVNPLHHSYKLRNDETLVDGNIESIIARISNHKEYNPTLAHYFSYLCSLLNDELTSPARAIRERLKWTDTVEYHALDNTLLPKLLLMTVGSSVVITIGSGLSFEGVKEHFGKSSISSTREIPYRFSVAEDYRNASKKDQGARFPVPRGGENEPLTGSTDKGKIQIHEEALFTSRLLMDEIRAFCSEAIGVPMSFTDSVRLANKESQPNDHNGLAKYEVPRPRIYVTGHSVGGAMAQICASYLSSLYGRNMVCCYTFGQPRVGNAKFCDLYSRYCCPLFRVVNVSDPIVHMPRKSPGFSHVKNTRVQYTYPPLLTREGYEHHLTIEEGKARRSIDAIKGLAKGLKRKSETDLRVHTNYAGITIPMKATYAEPYSFIIHRLIDNLPPQNVPAKGDPPKRAELDLSMENIPFEAFLRDAEPWDKTALRRRLLVYTGARQRPFSRYTTPIVSTNEEGRQQATVTNINPPPDMKVMGSTAPTANAAGGKGATAGTAGAGGKSLAPAVSTGIGNYGE